ncbi:sigma factor sigB regulation protein rsbQ [Bhargavaea cecembensis]|uniref:Sigma factor sigB regulation protein rsbQ n=1 Tax=Bhargavaea cecembensis TaxID=394098 RepID=A0A165H450_9BACL|nr:alpha/beta hydrolase [Bhargavaea cecembensis]KZE38725.1 sigma factor sigB regulation protein rsbQ [Bhargavaea cecembensis]
MKNKVMERNHVTISGSGERTLVFGHGLGCDQTVWERVAPAFENGWRVVLFDYVGSGRSDRSQYRPSDYNSLEGYARDVIEIIDALDLKDAVFIGHSVSAMIGTLASIKRPEAIGKLIMIGPSPRYLNAPGYPGGYEREDVEELLELMERNYKEWAKYMAPASMKNTDRPFLADELEERFISNDPVIIRQFAEVTFMSDVRDKLAEISIPTLILQAQEDSVAPIEVGKFVHEQIPGSTFRVLSAKGHNPHISDPEETISEIQRYLNQESEIGTSVSGRNRGASW